MNLYFEIFPNLLAPFIAFFSLPQDLIMVFLKSLNNPKQKQLGLAVGFLLSIFLFQILVLQNYNSLPSLIRDYSQSDPETEGIIYQGFQYDNNKINSNIKNTWDYIEFLDTKVFTPIIEANPDINELTTMNITITKTNSKMVKD